MYFQTHRIKAKTLIPFSILVLAFTGCTSVEYQQMQSERDTRREVYEDARRKEARERNFLSGDMIGEWEFLDIVVEGSDASEDLLKAKAALTASRLKGFRLRFWKGSDTSYYYRIENLISKSYGKYVTRRVYWGDAPQTARLYMYPISGSHISDLIFNFTEVLIGSTQRKNQSILRNGTHRQIPPLLVCNPYTHKLKVYATRVPVSGRQGFMLKIGHRREN